MSERKYNPGEPRKNNTNKSSDGPKQPSRRLKRVLFALGLGVAAEGAALHHGLNQDNSPSATELESEIEAARKKDKANTNDTQPDLEDVDEEEFSEEELEPEEIDEGKVEDQKIDRAKCIAKLITDEFSDSLTVRCSDERHCEVSLKGGSQAKVIKYSFDDSGNCQFEGIISGTVSVLPTEDGLGIRMVVEEDEKDLLIQAGDEIQDQKILSAVAAAWRFTEQYLHGQDEVEKKNDTLFKEIEEYLAQGRAIEDLIEEGLITESTLSSLSDKYESGRSDPNNYAEQINSFLHPEQD